MPLLPPPSLQAELNAGASSLDETSIPAFFNLHHHLTSRFLDHEASTRAKNQEYEAGGITDRLKDSYVSSARDVILIRSLKEICLWDLRDSTLPAELRELCCVVSAYLASAQTGSLDVDANVEDLMAEELSEFRESLPAITEALSAYLNDLEGLMAKMLEPLTMPPSAGLKHPLANTARIPSSRTTTARTHKPTLNTLSSSTLLSTHQRSQSHHQNHVLPDLLTQLSTTLHDLLQTRTHLLTTRIRHSELHTHSSQSRHLTSHATFLGTVAQGLTLKSQILALQREKEVYAEVGVRQALGRRFEVLEKEERTLSEREAELKGAVEEYTGAEGVFERLGPSYGEVEAEIEVVRRDIERLEREAEGRGGGRGGSGRR